MFAKYNLKKKSLQIIISLIKFIIYLILCLNTTG